MKNVVAWSVAGVVGFVLFCALCLWAMPQYIVYQKRMGGEAVLAESESQKRVLVEQAKAELEAAKLRAEAIAIVGKASQEFPEYRTQEFIGAFAEAVQKGSIQQIIYVPTEASIPIVDKPRQ